LVMFSGDHVAVNLIQGNAYQEAISYLKSMDERKVEDEYNLALSYEASGNNGQARLHYETALELDPGNSQIAKALSRLK